MTPGKSALSIEPREVTMGRRPFVLLFIVAALAVAGGVAASTAGAATPGARLWARGIPQVVTPNGDEVVWIKPAPKGTV